MSDAITRLDELVRPMDIPWNLYCDYGGRLLPCEVRIHGDGPYRILERGGSIWEAAAKAADRVEAATLVS